MKLNILKFLTEALIVVTIGYCCYILAKCNNDISQAEQNKTHNIHPSDIR